MSPPPAMRRGVGMDPEKTALRTAVLSVDADGVLVIRMLPVDGSSDDARAVREAHARLAPYGGPVLIDARAVRSLSRAAMEEGATRDLGIECMAILVESAVSVVLANVFFFLVRPPYPTRMFRDEADARSWLASKRTRKAG